MGCGKLRGGGLESGNGNGNIVSLCFDIPETEIWFFKIFYIHYLTGYLSSYHNIILISSSFCVLTFDGDDNEIE